MKMRCLLAWWCYRLARASQVLTSLSAPKKQGMGGRFRDHDTIAPALK
jgi:hypothetical protein